MRNAMIVVLLALPAGWFAFSQSTKTPPAPPANPLSGKQLAGLLKQIDFEPRPLSDDVFQISVDRENWKVHVMVSAPAESDSVWLECKFAPIGQPELVASAAWLRLLDENERISPAHFAFDKSDKRVHLYKSFPKAGMSPGRLKVEIERFDATVRRTQPLWRSENFVSPEVLKVPPRAAEDPEITLLKGDWRVVRIETKGKSATRDQLPFKPTYAFDGDSAVLKLGPEEERKVKVKIDSTQKPKQIDFIDDLNRVERGIYFIENGLLTVCVASVGEKERPRHFATDPKNKWWLMVLRKEE